VDIFSASVKIRRTNFPSGRFTVDVLFWLVGVVQLETSDGMIQLRQVNHDVHTWHVVKHQPTDSDAGAASDNRMSTSNPTKVIPEIFLSRLLITKVRTPPPK